METSKWFVMCIKYCHMLYMLIMYTDTNSNVIPCVLIRVLNEIVQLKEGQCNGTIGK